MDLFAHEIVNASVEMVHAMWNEPIQSRFGGSFSGRVRIIDINREVGHNTIVKDCFHDSPRCHDQTFRRQFYMHHSFFLRLMNVVVAHDVYFTQCYDCTNTLSILSHLKM